MADIGSDLELLAVCLGAQAIGSGRAEFIGVSAVECLASCDSA